ncbi:uncharacterized protein BDW43DRAFT_261198 [Aspergillus alliaceus]|uniref:uncharacterized protein n=1 Tax=Petromyces alliaceus TaxID=209559 RepID=UPI0012A758DD|nr:uncharacterized protein BDW43DRAFT_261198 [Aspergillus alliaceus]KAB8239279.1 hypothetical protein BDW43DRAFT_261198 [Aspergillus alliaceus]
MTTLDIWLTSVSLSCFFFLIYFLQVSLMELGFVFDCQGKFTNHARSLFTLSRAFST